MCELDVALKFKCWKSKVITNINVKLQGGISNLMVPGPSTPAPIPFYNA